MFLLILMPILDKDARMTSNDAFESSFAELLNGHELSEFRPSVWQKLAKQVVPFFLLLPLQNASSSNPVMASIQIFFSNNSGYHETRNSEILLECTR